MKKFLVFGMMSAMALTFVACSSEDAINENVVVTKDGDAVKTRFALSLTNNVKTRMTATAAQETGAFNGMEDIVLFPKIGAIGAQTALDLQMIKLADFSTFDAETANGKVYSDVLLPIGVDHFLFYGRSADSKEGELVASYDEYLFNTATTPAEAFTFELVPFQEGMTLEDLAATDEAKAVIEALNAIYGALVEAELEETASIFETLTAGNTNSIGYFISDLVETLTHGDVYSDEIKAVVEEYFTVTGDAENGFEATWNGTPFPANLNLPDGAVVVKFVDGEFAYAQGTVAGLNQPAPGTFVKPAELFYWINTTSMVSDEVEYGAGTWQGLDWPGVQGLYEDGAVKATTNSVIMKDQVQYGVGRLDAQVRIAEEKIYDSGSGIEGAADEDPQQVTVPANGFKMTGILIGGQKNVGWDFTPMGDDEYTIWDNIMTPTNGIFAVQGEAYSDINYTLALQTAPSTVINIAVEFENTANDFYGVNNQLIPAGSKFYLVAQLNPDGANASNKEATGKRVFMQDFATKLKLTIGAESLQSAYNVIPDLRSPRLEFGLSVNLEWQEGITFEQEF